MDVCNVKSGFSFPERFQQIYKNDLIPFFKVQDLNNYNFNTKTKFGISNKDVLMNKYKVFTKESICFAKVGEACKLNRKIKIKEKEYLVDNNLSLLFLLEEKNNINFLFFLCLKINFNKFINNGSLPSISLLDLLNFPIFLPSLQEQQKIAHFFSLLDKQIQLWERKLELYELILKKMLKNHFFNKNEFNHIKDFFTFINGISSEHLFTKKETNLHVISIGNFSKDSQYISDGNYININENVEKKYIPNKNDLVMILNDKTLSLDILGRVILIDKSNSYYINQRTIILRPNIQENSWKWYIYFLSDIFRYKIKKISNSGNQCYINCKDLYNIKIVDVKNIPEKLFITINLLLKIKKGIINKKEQIKKIKKFFLQKMFA